MLTRKAHLLFVCFIGSLVLNTSAFAGKTASNGKYYKPGAPVYLLEPNFLQMSPNSETDVTIRLATPTSGTLHINVKPKDGLSISENSRHTIQLSEQQTEFNITLAAQASGQYDLMLHAELTGGELLSTRVMGFSVQVGEPQVTAQKEKPNAPYVFMKAQETIH